MSYLTQVPQREIGARTKSHGDSPDARHQGIMSLFGDLPGTPRKDAGILFRLERLPGREPTYLVRSLVPVAYPTDTTRTKLEFSELPPVGSYVAFRVAVNAVQRVHAKDGFSRSKIRPVRNDADTVEDGNSPQPTLTPWLTSRLAGALTEVSILNHVREVVGVKYREIKGGPKKVIQIDTVDGVAEVANPAILERLLAQGVGRERSYGCGLLTVKELR